MNNILKDARHGLRSLLRQPAFTVVAVITLALGIGANTAIFSLVNAVLLRALPFQNPEQLVSIGKAPEAGGLPGLAGFQYLAWKDRSTSFDGIAAYTDDNFNLIGSGDPERISCARVTASLFPTLGVKPLVGRTFLPEEDRPGQNRVAVVSEGFWQRRYGREASLVGNSIQLDDKRYTVVGIMPSSFRFPGEFEIWLPLALDPIRETQGDFWSLVEVVGRVKPGVTVQQAQTDLDLISQQAAAQQKEKATVTRLELHPLHQQLVVGVRLTLLVLWGAVGLVMLLACANVTNLMLARTVSRQREMAIRAAVGGRRWQLIRQLLGESLVLGITGGVLGLLLALWGVRAIASLVPEGFASSVYDLNAIALDWRVFGFTFALSLLMALLFGIVPALTGSRPDLLRLMRETSPRNLMGLGLHSMRGWLVVTELALALILLLGAGLLVKSFRQLTAVDLGFNRENVLMARLNLPRSVYRTEAQTTAFYGQLLERVKTLPGVQSTGAINHTPLSGFGLIVFTGIEGQRPPDQEKDLPIGVGAVSPDYFRTLQILLISGRVYDERDRADAPRVAIVNQAFAQRYFPAGDVLGKRVGFGCKESLCTTIVGVVGNVKQESITADVGPEMYVPFSQMPLNSMTLFVRTTGKPTDLAQALRAEVFAIDKNQPVYSLKTLDQRVVETIALSRSLMLLFSGFALLALVLACVGIYGVVSYSVSQRTREIGIRMALGARAVDVLRLVLKNGMTLVIAGVASGVAGALALTRFLTTLLFGVTPTDTTTFVVVSVVLALVALVACLVPARRATKVDPLVALKYE
ncbi:MAG TPA: ABC transporter permease [Pyrinomonadaceae bacterium]|jgi:putative ABC transport system permease protein|nr:ABC transporter permease [Pyrinomonadaceae bacterium]